MDRATAGEPLVIVKDRRYCRQLFAILYPLLYSLVTFNIEQLFASIKERHLARSISETSTTVNSDW